jgi:hypothetical protein
MILSKRSKTTCRTKGIKHQVEEKEQNNKLSKKNNKSLSRIKANQLIKQIKLSKKQRRNKRLKTTHT